MCVKAPCQVEINIVDFWLGIENLRQSLIETLLGETYGGRQARDYSPS